MGNFKSKKSKKVQSEPDRFFEREKWKQQKREEKRSKPSAGRKRVAGVTPPGAVLAGAGAGAGAPLPPPPPRPAPSSHRSYDEEALERMRHQLHQDSDAFLLNNILLSVQFFENYDKEVQQLKNTPTPEWDSQVNASMVRHNKHVFLADKLQESVHARVRIRRAGGVPEPLSAQRMYVIYDNIEASEPGDTSDYSAVLDAPFYKMLMEETKEPGYINLRKLEVLQNFSNENVVDDTSVKSERSEFTDSEKESNSSDDPPYPTRSQGEALLLRLKTKLDIGNVHKSPSKILEQKTITIDKHDRPAVDVSGRRPSGPIRHINSVAEKATLSNMTRIKQSNVSLGELKETEKRKLSGITKADLENFNAQQDLASTNQPRKSILKTSNRKPSGPTREPSTKYVGRKLSDENSIAEETETSGYRSNSTSSPQYESSGTESDYGYSTITELTTPKPLTMSSRINVSESTGTVPEECWTSVQVKATGHWSDDDDDDEDEREGPAPDSRYKTLYETYHYMNSLRFMGNFVDIFMTKIGKALGFSSDAIENALTQGASIYCDTMKYNSLVGYEVVPAVIAAWPNSANEWIIRQRRIIQNPRTNFSYQWPTKYMVNKARGLGCLLVPVGYRPKKGTNPDQQLQWRLVFPAAERYLESCLAHSQVRCYLFTLALVKTFMENETSKNGIDASHIKNHLFWECEDNYARWPEDRLGETLRIFLKSLYRHFGHARFPDYFIETRDNFKSIPKTMLLKLQRRLADVLETPVMHVLYAIRNLKYTSKDFYPQFDYMRLYRILTTKNVLRLINPNIQEISSYGQDESGNSDTEDEYKEAQIGFWDKAKSKDKHYQWKKEQQRQAQARRKAAAVTAKARKSVASGTQFIDKSISLPAKMDVERRRLVLEFFITHFIAMAQRSDKYDATKQAIIYLEQAQRLSVLLREEPGGEEGAADFLSSIRAQITDCKMKLVSQSGLKPPKRSDSVLLHNFSRTRLQQPATRGLRPEYINLHCQDSPPPPSPGSHTFTFADVHADQPFTSARTHSFKFDKELDSESDEESKL